MISFGSAPAEVWRAFSLRCVRSGRSDSQVDHLDSVLRRHANEELGIRRHAPS